MLYSTDNEGMSAWYMAATESNLELLQNVWEWAEKKLKTQELNNKFYQAYKMWERPPGTGL